MESNEKTYRDLILRLKQGDEQSFRLLFDKFGTKLFYFSLKHNIGPEEAEEIVQEVFVKIWEKKEDLNEELSFNAYIFTIARNLIFNISRKQVNRRIFEQYHLLHSDQAFENIENDLIYQDLESLVKEIIQDLPPKARQIFRLSRLEGFSNQEIANKLNIKKKTVENQMHSALKHVRKSLSSRDDISLSILPVLFLLLIW